MANGHGGKRIGAGRKPGAENQFNQDIKTMVLEALDMVGGAKYLASCAHKQPGAFLTLVGKVLPLQLAGTGQHGEVTSLSFEWAAAQPPLIEGETPTEIGQFRSSADMPSATPPLKHQ